MKNWRVFSEGFYKFYYEEFTNKPLAKLLKEHDQIELQLRSNIVESAKLFLKNKGVKTFTGNALRYKDTVYNIITDFTLNGRLLRIGFIEIGDKKNNDVITRSIDDIGEIRTLILDYPKKYPLLFDELADFISIQICSAYLALKKVIIGKSSDFHRDALKLLYEFFDGHLQAAEKSHLLGKLWFVVFENGSGYYSFSGNMYQLTLDHFVQNQNNSISPLRLTIWMSTKRLPFSKSLSKESFVEQKTLSTAFAQAKYIEEAYEFWKANYLLFKDKEYSVTPICKTRDYVLTAACPKKFESELVEELSLTKENLETQFKNNLKNCSIWISNVSDFPKQSLKDSSLVDMAADLTAKTIYSLLDTLFKTNM